LICPHKFRRGVRPGASAGVAVSADVPDQKGWRINAGADYGPLGTFARGKVDLGKIRRHWGDILRVVASIYTGAVRAYDVVTMLQRDGHPTPLGEAIAGFGRIHKTVHICTYAVKESYRRDIKAIRNLQEGRHALAGKLFHGKKGELYHRYEPAWRTSSAYSDLSLTASFCEPRCTWTPPSASSRPRATQCGRRAWSTCSPFVNRHLGVHGVYNFALPDLAPGTIRALRDPDAAEHDDEL
jgi:Tn3 transposase DDE domain